MSWDQMSLDEFRALPLVVKGESKEIRKYEDGCLIRLRPTVYSYTHNRCGVVIKSNGLRLRASRVFLGVLRENNIKHAYREVGEHYIYSDLIADPPPVEVVVKAFHTGTSKHRYYGMSGAKLRDMYAWKRCIQEDQSYPNTIVRFDWRNPIVHPVTGERLPDEVLCEDQADWFIDVKKARQTALATYAVLSHFLTKRGIILCDICFFITRDGETVFGEISQDCGRFRHVEDGSFDKDVWRAGGSSDQVYDKWLLLCEAIGG